MRHYQRLKGCLAIAFLFLTPLLADADDLYIHDDIQTYSSLTDTTVYMTGTSELHITSDTNPIPGCQINLNSEDSWFFMEQVRPSDVVSTYLSQVQVDGSPAVLNSNVRVDQYLSGAVVIPHPPSYQPLQIYSDFHYGGSSMSLGLYTYYTGSSSLGSLNNNVCSFKLKRGYMATFAQDESGTGRSKNYVAQDSDVNVEIIPEELFNSVSFIRVFPWRWTNKKGWAGGGTDIHEMVEAGWFYDWDNVTTSSQNTEYVPMRHNLYWNAYSNINNKQKSTSALAFNEPDKADQANMTVEQAIEQWPNLTASGLRLGSPAPSDGGLSWLYDFIDAADALDLRVDFVAVHCYQGCYSGSQWYNWLKQVHDRTGRPIWVTEWNNGCNWTGCEPVSEEEQADKIAEFIGVMDGADFVERYSVYNACGTSRELITGGVLTLAGEVYRDNQAPMAYITPPQDGTGECAYYKFDNDTLDSTSYGNHAISHGGQTYMAGHIDQSINFDGSNDYVELPENLADGEDFTFAAWVFWYGGGQWQRIFDFGANNQRYMLLTPRSGGDTLRFAISVTSYVDEQRLDYASHQLPQNTWTHVAVTISGNTGKLFVNGSPVVTNPSMTLNPSDLKTLRNYLGRSQFTPDPYFMGRLDEVIVADYAMTDTQIANLAADSPPANYPPVFTTDPIELPSILPGESLIATLIYSASDLDAGETLTFSKISGPDWMDVAADGWLTGTPGFGDLGENTFTIRVTDSSAAYDEATLNITVLGLGLKTRYKFDGNANDSIGSKHGTVTGSVTYPAGQIGLAIDLDGSEDYVTLPDELVNTDDITIAAWVNWDSGDIWQRIFDFGNNTTEYMFLTPGSYSSTLRFAITTSGNGGEQRVEVSSSYLPTGQWRHVAVTLDGDVGRLYVSGTQRAINTSMSLNPTDFNPTVNYIGKSQWPDPLFDGRIDDFRIYNFALSGPDIATLAAGNANNPPSFIDDPFSSDDAVEDANYEGVSIAASAFDLDGGLLTYSKTAGPAWLSVASDGSLSGTPSDADVGENEFTVRAENSAALTDTAQMNINVLNIYSGVRGFEDLAGFTLSWLESSCPDTPACGGADLDGDMDVDFFDYITLLGNWPTE